MCPHCNYDEASPRSAVFLPHGITLGGQYRVGRVLGKPGGFGITYLGWDINLQQRVAIKEYLPREIATRRSDSLDVTVHTADDRKNFEFGKEQFLREARIVARLDHGNVVRVRNYFNANGTAYLVMDYYEGLSLGDYLSVVSRTLAPDLAVTLLKPVLDGLHYVHQRGLVHRDLKPANIYLAAIGRPIVLDFGAARHAASGRSKSISVVLTEGYAPLEQYQRRAIQGPWTDVYGIAATLYRMLTGQAPPIALDRIGKDPMDDSGWESVDPVIIPTLRRALAVRPAERYQSAQEFRDALDRLYPDNVEDAASTSRKMASDVTTTFAYESGVPRPVIAARVLGDAEVTEDIALSDTLIISAGRSAARSATVPSVAIPGLEMPDSISTRRSQPGGIDSERTVQVLPPQIPATGQTRSAPTMPISSSIARAETPVTTPKPRPLAPPKPKVDPEIRRQRLRIAGVVGLALVLGGAIAGLALNPPREFAEHTTVPTPAPALPAAKDVVLAPPQTTPVDDGKPPQNVPPTVGIAGLAGLQVSVTEVTMAQFGEFVAKTGYQNPRWQNYPCTSAGGRLPEWDKPGYASFDDHPVTCVSAADAVAYAEWLSRTTAQPWRLPTAQEWKTLASGGQSTRFWWGNDYQAAKASCQDCPPANPTQPARTSALPENPYGLRGTLGNVREWTCSSPADAAHCSAPTTPHVVAGGSWYQAQTALELGHTDDLPADSRDTWTGFRLVLGSAP